MSLEQVLKRPPEELGDLTFEDLPVGTRVRVIVGMADFHFFNGDTGVVVRNTRRYRGVMVRFDTPRRYRGSPEWVMRQFGFAPDELEIIEAPAADELAAVPHDALCEPPEEVFS